jgi:hypothetical protein
MFGGVGRERRGRRVGEDKIGRDENWGIEALL